MIQAWSSNDGDDGAEMWRDIEGEYVLRREYEEEVRKIKDAPASDLPRLVACAVIFDGYRVLLERRAPAQIDGLDGRWDLPGGKVECGEPPADTVVREMKEELGVTVMVDRLIPELKLSKWTYPDGVERHWILAAYVCRIIEGELQLNANLQWFSVMHLELVDILPADKDLISRAWTRL